MKAQLHFRFIVITMMMIQTDILPAQTYQWVSIPAGYTVNGIATDGEGNVYVVGRYDAAATIGSFTLSPLDMFSGYSDIFVAKYNSAGTVLWAKNAYPSKLKWSLGVILPDMPGELIAVVKKLCAVFH